MMPSKSKRSQLKIKIPSDRVTNWMLISNRLVERQTEGDFPRWEGVLFSITHTYEPFKGGAELPGLELVELSDSAQSKVGEVKIEQFHDGDFLFISVDKKQGSGTNPSSKPADDARKLWKEHLHNHVEACNGGVILWIHPEQELRLTMWSSTDPSHKKYEFECDVAGPVVIKHFDKNGKVLVDYSEKQVDQVYFKGYDDPDPRDPINPPRY